MFRIKNIHLFLAGMPYIETQSTLEFIVCAQKWGVGSNRVDMEVIRECENDTRLLQFDFDQLNRQHALDRHSGLRLNTCYGKTFWK